MPRLIECTTCRGLKQAESARCPHCESQVAPASRLLNRALAATGVGAVIATLQFQTACSAYGTTCFVQQDGACLVCKQGEVAVPSDEGLDVYQCVDAGFSGGGPDAGTRDGGPPDGGKADGG